MECFGCCSKSIALNQVVLSETKWAWACKIMEVNGKKELKSGVCLSIVSWPKLRDL